MRALLNRAFEEVETCTGSMMGYSNLSIVSNNVRDKQPAPMKVFGQEEKNRNRNLDERSEIEKRAFTAGDVTACQVGRRYTCRGQEE